MAELISIARPYARAAFEYADEHNVLPQWQSMLNALAQVASDAQVRALLANPKVTNQQMSAFFLDVLSNILDEQSSNFINLVGKSGRLAALPEMSALFQQLVEQKLKTITAKVIVAQALSQEQQQNIKKALEKRLEQEVELDTIIDPAVYGGVRVQANDLVIDGTIRGRLQRLF